MEGTRSQPFVALHADDRDDDLAVGAGVDRDAFALLYERHRLAVFRYLRARTPSDDEAAELTAVTFEKALRSIARYRPRGGGFPAWLLRIARNASIDAVRRQPAARLVVDPREARDTVSPEVIALDGERRSDLIAAINNLPPIQREAVALRYAAGLTTRQIAEVVGKSEGATQKLISRALAAIRESGHVER